MTASPGAPLPVAVRASGCWIEDADGSRYLDACGGAMVMLLGHCHPASRRGASRAGGRARVHLPVLVPERADARPRRAGRRGSRPATSSGASSTRPAPRRTSRRCTSRCSTGSSWAGPARSSSCRASRRTTARRWARSRSRARAGGRRSSCSCASTRSCPNCDTAEEGAAALEAAILSRGADHVAAFVVEPVTGSSGAAVPLPDGYLAAVREVCDRHDVLLVADEVITGVRAHRPLVRGRARRRRARRDHVRQGHRRRRHPALGDGRVAAGCATSSRARRTASPTATRSRATRSDARSAAR